MKNIFRKLILPFVAAAALLTSVAVAPSASASYNYVCVPGSPARCGYPGLKGEYWNNSSWSGVPTVTQMDADPSMNANWGYGQPHPYINADYWTARWTGYWKAPVTSCYSFNMNNDDYGSMWINGTLVIPNHFAYYESGYNFCFNAGQSVSIRIDYREVAGAAAIYTGFKAFGGGYVGNFSAEGGNGLIAPVYFA